MKKKNNGFIQSDVVITSVKDFTKYLSNIEVLEYKITNNKVFIKYVEDKEEKDMSFNLPSNEKEQNLIVDKIGDNVIRNNKEMKKLNHFLKYSILEALRFLAVEISYIGAIVGGMCLQWLPLLAGNSDVQVLPLFVLGEVIAVSFSAAYILTILKTPVIHSLWDVLSFKIEKKKLYTELKKKEIEKIVEGSKEQVQVTDKYLSYISKLVSIINISEDKVDNNTKQEIVNLVNEYTNAKKKEINGGDLVDYPYFITRYINIKKRLEKMVYSKELSIEEVDSKRQQLFKEFNVTESNIEDAYLQEIYREIERINRNRYDGYLSDIDKLYNIAEEYCKEDIYDTDGVISDKKSKLIKELADISLSSETLNRNRLQRQALKNDLEKIKGYITYNVEPGEFDEKDSSLGRNGHL